MQIKTQTYIGFILIIISIGIIIISYVLSNFTLFFLGLFLIVVSVIALIVLLSIDVFRRDKILDLDKLRKEGLTIVECPECSKSNVLEDKYCIFCGEKLV